MKTTFLETVLALARCRQNAPGFARTQGATPRRAGRGAVSH